MSQLEQLLEECHFLDLAERPGLWLRSLNWYVETGQEAQSALQGDFGGPTSTFHGTTISRLLDTTPARTKAAGPERTTQCLVE
jgi:hypothetical protein